MDNEKAKVRIALLVSLVLFFSMVGTLLAQGRIDFWTGGLPLGNNSWLSSVDANGQTGTGLLKSDGSGNTFVNTKSGQALVLSIAQTPVATINASGITTSLDTYYAAGKAPALIPYVPTMAATPVAGTNQFMPGYNVVPTAAANTAAILGAATPTPGAVFHIYNAGANTVRVKAGGGATMNGATAGGYLALATKLSATCRAQAANYDCTLNVNPTPAGP